MPTTYELIAKNVLGSDTATVTFGSIPGTFDDLYFQLSIRGSNTSYNSGQTVDVELRPNGSTSNRSSRVLYAGGTTVGSLTYAAGIYPQMAPNSSSWTANTFTSGDLYIPNYSAATNKSMSGITVSENNNASSGKIWAISGLWNDTSAITSFTFVSLVNSFLTGSSFYLYGIAKA